MSKIGMRQRQKKSSKGSLIKAKRFCCFFSGLAAAAWVVSAFAAVAFSQEPVSTPAQTTTKPTSAKFVAADGLTVERLIELAGSRRADLLAARQRLAGAVEVEDTGGGIDKEILPKIFDPFFTTKEKGVGLSIAHKIAAQHNGQLSVSVKNSYTVFSLQLPKNY